MQLAEANVALKGTGYRVRHSASSDYDFVILKPTGGVFKVIGATDLELEVSMLVSADQKRRKELSANSTDAGFDI